MLTNLSQTHSTRHHYRFVHWALRRYSVIEPQVMFDKLCSDSASEYLKRLFDWIVLECAEDGPATFGVDQIKVQCVSDKIGAPAVMIMMPTPSYGAQANCACLVKTQEGFRLFTSEKVHTEPGEPIRTFFCEWTGDTHMNYGDIAEDTATCLIAAIKGLL